VVVLESGGLFKPRGRRARGAEMTVLPSVSGKWGDDELDAFRAPAPVAVAGKYSTRVVTGYAAID